MCGIAGILNTKKIKIENLKHKLAVMNKLIAHRGPDDQGIWTNKENSIGLAHRRLSIIDLSQHAHQPMIAPTGDVIVYNGEIYNHVELRQALSAHWTFTSNSDTEVILAAYKVYGVDCVQHFRGMFAFAIWDGEQLFCARDQFGIKPFYYTKQDDSFVFASESKALLPFLGSIKTERQAFAEYITFQYPMGKQTLFHDVFQLEPAHAMLITANGEKIWRYWDVHYHIDYDHTARYFANRLEEILNESIRLHLRADVNIGAYVSGGVDSSLIGILATHEKNQALPFFHGRFLEDKAYDESEYAQHAAQQCGTSLHVRDITAQEFAAHFSKIIYHMDFPVAGPGVFPQYMVSELAAKHVKVVLGGQGGDEIFGGYARYVMAYFEQCMKAAIEGSYKKGNFVVTAESIIPNLEVLNAYKPLLKRFWSHGLFEPLEKRYFSLVDRGLDLDGEVHLTAGEREHVYQQFLDVFNAAKFEKAESYFDSMTHFDFKCLLPSLLHVEDRVSMAHGLEARVPFLYTPLIEFMATIPANIKFADGRMKHLLKQTFSHILPAKISNRKDKMGFPVPLSEWMQGELKDYVQDILHSGLARQNNFIDYEKIIKNFGSTGKFSRKIWGFLCYEIWQQQFHDQAQTFRAMLNYNNNFVHEECNV
ncbi:MULTISPECIES: asparagine synthase (glutamine-hydrolyzing) [Legionella]|uniref:asparagine synthase (glutamine-hydrolyzing) n=1 Tax=Legionella septentrionalis TaxID=2498109 RepID=A0A3S0X0W1_9GAMM|nr:MULTISPECIES: asparagine synthase (glutamine-hydrolyzing) [Legionella]MCP0914335.1 asparagine synthase (glutamine-hydrolyzing) [Legionella sp. 27cVA30]RUQ89003.1 asparagine synthase (glutamine-hydrolyzing) [Legionella septentrionalis]RUR00310.1 asparagine synthase (glutamine-hydrolyzing) [Legionella septentrionalis]RUR11833.1 asparagine synthase (glutamine-hydrolyzing) [Legionella septentrionalis]RUR17520.1 asparagine synthase (glutamine-hydrolyzing) [Legionella septentrionalis]